MTTSPSLLHQWLLTCRGAPALPLDLHGPRVLRLDLSVHNPDLPALDLRDTAGFDRYVFGKMHAAGADMAVGGYLEDRQIYRRSAHFGTADEESRSVHLGVDLWAPAGTPVFAMLPGRVHSFADNQGFGNYGPTVILQHDTPHGPLHSLYGHLSLTSLARVAEGQIVAAGERVGWLGPFPENGDWPPHLHLQLVVDLGPFRGDYPGVGRPSERAYHMANCPDPNLLLRSPWL
ncbi:MAG: peptidoglycan DD-metalloendopeptidase family protein [Catalinimonas sp.]